MTVFIIVAALLTAAALVFLLPPLVRHSGRNSAPGRRELNISIYRDQLAELDRDLEADVISREQYEQGRQELEGRLLEDVPGGEAGDGNATEGRRGLGSAVAVGIAVPALAVGIYVWLGMPAAISPAQTAASSAGMAEGDVAQQINQMVARLEQRLQEEPANAEGWAMLGRSYLVLERFGEARKALEKAVALDDGNPQVLVDYADALAMTTNQSLEGRPMKMIERALELDPDNQKALWLAGTAAYERADYATAIGYWRRLYDLVPADSQAARAMESNIAEARSLMDGEAPPALQRSAPPAAEDAADAGPGAGGDRTVAGTVRLGAGMRDQVDASDTVFIFARAPQGPRMPLAVMRARVSDLPLEYTLDDSMAMDPSMSISKFSEVEIVARVSKSGNAMARSGDLQGRSPVVPTGSEGTEVVIDEVVP